MSIVIVWLNSEQIPFHLCQAQIQLSVTDIENKIDFQIVQYLIKTYKVSKK